MKRRLLAILSCLFSSALTGATCDPDLFINAVSYPTQPTPMQILTADFNGDGYPDVATLNYAYYNIQSVTVLLGNPDGTFQPPIVTHLDEAASAFVAGKFDADDVVDLVLSGFDGNIRTLPGNGDGTFKDPIVSLMPPNSNGFLALAGGNLDSGPTLDLVGTMGDVTLRTMLGNGDGTFGAPATFATGVYVNAIALGDVNGDGHLDAVGTGNSNLVTVLLGNGDGTFGPASQVVGGNTLNDVHLADLDGDGALDIAAASGAYLAVLLGNGDGSFRAAHDYPAGNAARFVGISDFNGDGIPDAVVGNLAGSDAPPTFWMLLGNGDGTFVSGGTYLAGTGIGGMTVGTFGSAGPGVVSADDGSHVWALLGNGDGTLQAVRGTAFTVLPTALARGPFNADVFPDLAVGQGSTLTILLGGAGTDFTPGQVVNVPNGISAIQAGDFTNDGVQDLITVGTFGGGLSLLIGNGDGTFQDPQSIGPSGYGYAPFLAIGDFNGDDRLDFAVANNTSLEVFLGNGNGTFQSPLTSELPVSPSSGIPADLNGDFIPDLVLANGTDCCYGSNTVTVLLGNGDGTFQAPATYATGGSPTSVTTADFNGDGAIDLATADSGDGTVSIFPGNGDGTFQAPVVIGLGWHPRTILADDFDGDGHPDLVTANRDADNAAVLRGLGGFQFESPVAYSASGTPIPMVLLDLYANGTPDVAIGGTQGLGGVTLLINPRLSVGTLGPFGACHLPGTVARLEGHASGFGKLAYQWRKDGVPLSDGGSISGATTSTLTIASPQVGDEGSYDLVVTDACTTVFSNATTFTVSDPPGTPNITLDGPVAPGVIAAASANPIVSANTYIWTVQGAVLLTGQGGPHITFIALQPGTMSLQVVQYSAPTCGTSSAVVPVAIDYLDVPPSNPFHDDIVKIAQAGITAGCGGGNYCPTSPVTRAQMAVFLLKANLGSDHVPPVYPQFFNDVPPGSFAYDWINELYTNGVTTGCGGGNYCPDSSVTRAQMSVFLLKTLVGGYYDPPYPPQIFGDVPQYGFAANFIADLYNRGITGGCSASPLLYCPDSPVNRGQMATFLVRTFPIP